MAKFIFIGASQTGYGATVYKSADETGLDFNTSPQIITFNTELYDDGDWFSVGSPTRLTVPSAISYVIVAAQFQIANSFNTIKDAITILKNGSPLSSPLVYYEDTSADQFIAQVQSFPLPVSSGDYFELRVAVQDTSADVVAAGTWFAAYKVG